MVTLRKMFWSMSDVTFMLLLTLLLVLFLALSMMGSDDPREHSAWSTPTAQGGSVESLERTSVLIRFTFTGTPTSSREELGSTTNAAVVDGWLSDLKDFSGLFGKSGSDATRVFKPPSIESNR